MLRHVKPCKHIPKVCLPQQAEVGRIATVRKTERDCRALHYVLTHRRYILQQRPTKNRHFDIPERTALLVLEFNRKTRRSRRNLNFIEFESEFLVETEAVQHFR
ncbi:Uncharacterised protein [Burkholderia pseudomallei]|nr:Uncharacterised protein [Burkholderia pseudomallei]VBR21770.1 Uncharacterised protein [Burkholderia pseudomallei]VBU18876.1 Uncharacterised protein [Burkholderia pseudomallei]VBU48908.1 Uncharacterised protein [Burkholderia pseudomallei]